VQVPTQDFFIKDMGIPLSMEPGVFFVIQINKNHHEHKIKSVKDMGLSLSMALGMYPHPPTHPPTPPPTRTQTHDSL
jgi:hypothetical protein